MAMPQSTTTKCSQKDAPQSLLDLIIDKGGFKEREARPLVQQLARTLSLLHKHGVVHRNLKLDNILLVSTGSRTTTIGTSTPAPANSTVATVRSPRLILTDFTYAAVSLAPVARCGDHYNPAPELFLSRKNPAEVEEGEEEGWVPSRYAGPPVDVWGLGVVLFTLVCHRVPFDCPTVEVLREASRHSPSCLTFPRRISRECKDLLRRMLHADPAMRASLEEVLHHPWMYSSKSAYTRQRPNSGSFLSAEGRNPSIATTTRAALKRPDEIDYERFHVCAALDSEAGDSDEAWRYLTETLALISRLCEAPDDAFDAPVQVQTCSSAARNHRPSSTLLFRGIRALADHRQSWSLFDKLRNVVSPMDWTSPFQASRRKRRSNVAMFRSA